jgi:hypothetical protein
MAHDSDCEAAEHATRDCGCATRAYLRDATPDERAAWDAAQGRTTVGHRLDVSQVQWRGRP